MFCANCGSATVSGVAKCSDCGYSNAFAQSASAASGWAGTMTASRPSVAPSVMPVESQVRSVQPQITVPPPNYALGKSPIVALILSFFVPGVGQFYNGDPKRGVPMFILGLVSFLILLIPVIGWIIAFGVHIWSMVNAYNVAAQKTKLG